LNGYGHQQRCDGCWWPVAAGHLQRPVAALSFADPNNALILARPRDMPITPFLDGRQFDPRVKDVMGLAFENARAALRLYDPEDLANKTLANRIIGLAEEGERDPNRLCELALTGMRRPPP
jgi:hypothetical protein